MESTDLSIDTSGRHLTDLTSEVAGFCRALGDGLLSVFVPHATAGVALMETGSGSEADLESLLEALIPRDDRYRHHHGSPGHGADHHPDLDIRYNQVRVALRTHSADAVTDKDLALARTVESEGGAPA